MDPRGSLEESNLDEFVNEMSSGFEGGNTTERSTFQECREKFLEENYPDISTGRHLHPPLFLAKQDIHGFFANPDTNKAEAKTLGEPPENLTKRELKQWKSGKKKEVNKNLNALKPSESKHAKKKRSNSNEKKVFEAVGKSIKGSKRRPFGVHIRGPLPI